MVPSLDSRYAIAALALIGACPASASEAPEVLDSYHALTSVAPKRNCAATSKPDEVVVCARRHDNLRYRLPPGSPAPGSNAARSVAAERFALSHYRGEGGSGSCSSVGPNGAMGCLALQMREREEQSAGQSPGLVGRVLTYLDPDE